MGEVRYLNSEWKLHMGHPNSPNVLLWTNERDQEFKWTRVEDETHQGLPLDEEKRWKEKWQRQWTQGYVFMNDHKSVKKEFDKEEEWEGRISEDSEDSEEMKDLKEFLEAANVSFKKRKKRKKKE